MSQQDTSQFGQWVRRWNVPNVLTVVRLVMTPIFIFALLYSHFCPDAQHTTWRWIALILFVLSMFTDQLDGFLARRYNVVTDFGKIADPIADKAIVLSAFVCLSIIGSLPWWVTIIILIRELGITFWRMIELRKGNVVPASKGGKLKTVLQTAAAILLILPLPESMQWLVQGSYILALIVTVVTGIQYLVDAHRLQSESISEA